MATNNSRDVRLNILVETLGEENVQKLRVALDALAKTGGDATPEFQQLTDQIDRLGNQAEAVKTLQDLAVESAQLATRETEAAAAVTRATDALIAQRAATEAAAQAQREAVAATEAARAANTEIATSLKLLRGGVADAEKGTQAYDDALKGLLLRQGQAKQALDEARLAQRAATAELTAAESAQDKLVQSQGRAATAAQKAADEVTRQAAVLTQARGAAEALGVSTENLATAEQELVADLQRVELAASRTVAQIESLAAAERELAALDAFNKQAADSERLFKQAAFAELFEEAIARLAQTERELAAQQALEKQANDAAQLQEAAKHVEALRLAAERLKDEEKELEAQQTFAKQAADAQNLVRAAEYVRFWEDSLNKAEAQAKQTAAEAERAGQRIANAFQTVGVKSVTDLQLEIANVRTSLAVLSTSANVTGGVLSTAFASGQARIRELEAEIRKASGAMTLADRAAGLLKNSLGQITAGNIIADGVGYMVNKVKEMGREFIEVTLQTERLRKGLDAVYKDTAVAAAQFDLLNRVATNSGVSVGAISDAFLRFSASTKASNIDLKVSNDLFEAVTRAGAALGLSAEATGGALDALGQIASKGTVSMEELRQQLGDRLPGALGLAATGLGITQSELIKLVEAGQLSARDFFPAFTAGLRTMSGDTDTLTGAWSRLTNALTVGAQVAGDAGGLAVLKVAVQGLAIALGVVVVPLQGFVELVNLAARGAYVFFEAISGNATTATFTEFGKQVDASATRLNRLGAALDTAVFGAKEQAAANTTAALSNSALASAVLENAAAQAQVGTAVASTGNAYVQQLVKMADTQKATEAAVSASEKLVKAKEDEGRALVRIAQISGDAARALEAQAAAARNTLAVSNAMVQAREREANATRANIAVIEAQAVKTGDLDGSLKKLIDTLNLKLTAQDADLEKSREGTAALEAQSAAARVAAEVYADNSSKVDAYRQSMESARATADIFARSVGEQTLQLGNLKTALDIGLVTQDEYNAAKERLRQTTQTLNSFTRQAAEAEALYKDGINDSVKALDLKSRIAAADTEITIAQAKAQSNHYEALARTAAAAGNEAQATQFRILGKQREIEAVRLSTQVKLAELDADQAGIQVQISALDPQDRLYEQKKAELEIRLKVIQAKRIEAGASADVIKGIQDEINALNTLNNTPRNSGGGGGGGGGLKNNNRNNDDDVYTGSTDYGKGQPNSKSGKDYFIDRDGLERRRSDGAAAGQFTNTLPIDKAFSVAQNGANAYGAGDIEFLKEARRQAENAKSQLDAMQRVAAGSVSIRAIQDTNAMLSATGAALQRAQELAIAGQGAAPGTGPTGQTVVINMNGKSRSIGVTDAANAAALQALLRELENGQGTNL